MRTITQTQSGTSKATLSIVSAMLILAFTFTFNFNAFAGDGGPLTAKVEIKSYNGAPESCYGANDAEITITATGGAGGYTYSIDNGNTFHSNNVFSGLRTGQNYVIVVKDQSGTKTNADWRWLNKVDNPMTLQVNYVQNIADCSPTSGYINCTAWGGTGAITYSIDNGATFQSSGIFKNLHAGTYNIIARDANGCVSVVKTATVTGSFTATVHGDTTVEKNATAYVRIFIENYTGKSNALFTAKGYDNYGTRYTEKNLKAGENKIAAIISKTITYTITSIELQGSSPVCLGYASGSATITVNDKNVWKGMSANWFDTKNWSFGTVPNANSNIEIPDTKITPEISGEVFVNTISLKRNAQLKISGILNLGGDIITENDHSIDALNGTIKYVGTTRQTVDGNTFIDNTISNVIAGNNIDITDSLNITNSISFVGSNKEINTNDFLVIRSTINKTAVVGQISDNNKIAGKVSVERYMPNVSKRWEFLSIPTKPGQTIHDAWQEDRPANDASSIKGYGIQLTGEMSDWDKKGFDRKSASPSIKVYNESKNSWTGVTSTLEPFSNPAGAYMVFIRGDRSANTTNATPTETILRTKGELKSGDQEVITVQPDKFAAIGNPYAAPIDLRKIKSSKPMIYYIWDSKLGTSYGAYQTIIQNRNGSFTAIPGGGTYKVTDQNVINSGYAFFAYNKSEGTIQITENAKVGNDLESGRGNSFGGTPTEMNTEYKELVVNLYSVASNGTATLVDGVMQSFNESYSDDIDEKDAAKSTNSTENLAIKTKGKLLAYETKALSGKSDTTVLNFTGMSYLTYRFEIDLTNFDENEKVFLLDNFTNTMTLLNPAGKNTYTFTVINNSGSWAANRFMIVFRPMNVLPVTMVNVKAEVKNSDIMVSWNVEDQKNVKSYVVERSADGSNFSAVGTVNAANLNAYSFTDKNALSGVNYYRVVSVDIDGKKGMSTVVKATMNTIAEGLSVYPNPIAGNNVHLKMQVQSKGIYYVSIKNQLGQVIDSRQVDINGNQRTVDINPATKLTPGVYNVEVIAPAGTSTTIQFIK